MVAGSALGWGHLHRYSPHLRAPVGCGKPRQNSGLLRTEFSEAMSKLCLAHTALQGHSIIPPHFNALQGLSETVLGEVERKNAYSCCNYMAHPMSTVSINKTFTFDDRRTIVLRCESLRFIPNEKVRERKRNGTKPRTERSEKRCVKRFTNYAQKLSNALDREIR